LVSQSVDNEEGAPVEEEWTFSLKKKATTFFETVRTGAADTYSKVSVAGKEVR